MFRPAVRVLPNDIKAVTEATGTCDGQPASWRATNAATVSCALLSSPGTVWLTVGSETKKYTAQTTIAGNHHLCLRAFNRARSNQNDSTDWS